MKATINGIIVEGTPQEIAEVIKLVGEQQTNTPINPIWPINPCIPTYPIPIQPYYSSPTIIT